MIIMMLNGRGEFQTNHGWWNCPDCRKKYHNYNLENVMSLMVQDGDGDHYSKRYLEDMKEWLLEQERYEEACKVRDLIVKHDEVFVKEGLPFKPSPHYPV